MRIDDRLNRIVRIVVIAAAALTLAPPARAGQSGPPNDLAQRVERRFSVLSITDGVVLTPLTPIPGARSIELQNGTVSIDGAPVTGAELRRTLGADADTVLQLSYLPLAQQRAFAARPRSAAPGAPSATEPPAASAPPAPEPEPQDNRGSSSRGDNSRFDSVPPRARENDLVRFTRDIHVERGDVVRGDAVAILHSIFVSGEVRGDVVAIGGNVELGPDAVVSGDVVDIGGTLTRDPSARVGGDVRAVPWRGNIWNRTTRVVTTSRSPFGAPLALIGQITRIALLCMFAALVVLFAGNIVERVGQRAAAEPLKAGAVGFLAQVLFLPVLIVTIIVLVVTIIGIPLLVLIPFALVGLVVVALVGFTAVASRIGQLVATRLSWNGGPYLRTLAGVVVLLIPLLVARVIGLAGFPLSVVSFLLLCVGWIVEYAAWTIGLGAVALTRFSKPPVVAIEPKTT
jgi:hypothetical protein